jgi:hypothetical protein
MGTVPRKPAHLLAWIDSLTQIERETVFQTILAAAELRALGRLVGAPHFSSNVQPGPAVASNVAPQPAPAPQPGTIHPYFGWREAKK